MLGTFDLDDVDMRSPDGILATLDPGAADSGVDDTPKAPPSDDRAAIAHIADVEDGQSDDILRELEEHHRRGHTSARPSTPRGSAELRPTSSRHVAPTRKRPVQSRASGEAKPRGRRRRVVLSLVAVFTATASVVTLSHLTGTAARLTTPVRSGRLAATTAITLAPAKIFDTVASAIAREQRQLPRHVAAPAKHHLRIAIDRKRSARHHLVTNHAAVAPVASTPPASSTPSYSSSSSAPASSSQPATSTAATATSSTASHQSQPAFGLNGSLGPGRGAPGTQ